MAASDIAKVTPENALKHSFFCIKDTSSPGFRKKQEWYRKRYGEGLRLLIIRDSGGKPAGFIEYVPAVMAWRPVDAPGYMFIHCTMVYPNRNKGKGYATRLLNACENDTKERGLAGLCAMVSDGSWMADRRLFERHGFVEVARRGRFQLLARKWEENAPDPSLIDWKAQQEYYQGWHLLYADQCPWHDKTVEAIGETAREYGLDLRVKKIRTSAEAKKAPSGFGVFSLLHDGKLLADHYISETRFRNILAKELE